MALPDSLTTPLITTGTYERLALGKWIDSSSTVDQPITLSVNSTVNPDGISDFVIRYDRAVNNNIDSYGKDFTMSIYLVARYHTRTFTQAMLASGFVPIRDLMASAPTVTKIMRGER